MLSLADSPPYSAMIRDRRGLSKDELEGEDLRQHKRLRRRTTVLLLRHWRYWPSCSLAKSGDLQPPSLSAEQDPRSGPTRLLRSTTTDGGTQRRRVDDRLVVTLGGETAPTPGDIDRATGAGELRSIRARAERYRAGSLPRDQRWPSSRPRSG